MSADPKLLRDAMEHVNRRTKVVHYAMGPGRPGARCGAAVQRPSYLAQHITCPECLARMTMRERTLSMFDGGAR